MACPGRPVNGCVAVRSCVSDIRGAPDCLQATGAPRGASKFFEDMREALAPARINTGVCKTAPAPYFQVCLSSSGRSAAVSGFVYIHPSTTKSFVPARGGFCQAHLALKSWVGGMIMARTWSCLDHDKRVQLEALIRAGHSKKEVAALLGCHLSTVYRELKRGRCKQRDWHFREYYVYSVTVAEADAKKKRSNCGAPLKLGGNLKLAAYVEQRIIADRYSPAAVSAELRHSELGYLCEDTIYRYIHRRIFQSLRPSHLPYPQMVQKRTLSFGCKRY